MRTNTVDESAPKATMGEFSHSNPYTGETFGDEMAFERGPTMAADGGRAGPEADDADEQTMEDVDHEHPHDDADEANRVFARGHDDGEDSV
ncbi:MAG: hypothetical protein V5A28_12545 [Haloarculaceae archaeon]